MLNKTLYSVQRRFLMPIVLGFAALTSACSDATSPHSVATTACTIDPAGEPTYRVERVYDGDTLRLSNGDKVRIIGLNTPEKGRDGVPAEPLAEAATTALRQMIGPTQRVLLLDGKEREDRFGRRLAHVFDSNGASLAQQMLSRGMGFHVVISPNSRFVSCLQDAEHVAATAASGVWAQSYFAARDAAAMPGFDGGFVRVADKVTRVSFKDNGWWVQLGGKIGLKISSGDQHLFQQKTLRELQGQVVHAQGWATSMRGGWWQMRVSHPAMLRVLE